jgi:hypothetical protein
LLGILGDRVSWWMLVCEVRILVAFRSCKAVENCCYVKCTKV